MPIWHAILLGVVQGLTEFLPISSTAHLLIVREWLGHENPEDAFTVVIQLGTLAAVFAYFRADIVRLLRGLVIDLRAQRIGVTPEGRMAWLIGVGTIPGGLTGLFLKKWLKHHFYNPTAIALVAIVFGVLMFLAEMWARLRRNVANPGRGEADIGWFDAIWIGIWQALALMPGASRSGTTITGGLFAGLTRPTAARFSFLLSLPIMLAAGAKEFWDGRQFFISSGDALLSLTIGLVTAAVVGYASIAWLLHFLRNYSMMVFVLYRIGLGILLLVLISSGMFAK